MHTCRRVHIATNGWLVWMIEELGTFANAKPIEAFLDKTPTHRQTETHTEIFAGVETEIMTQT